MRGRLLKNAKSPAVMIRVKQHHIDHAFRCKGHACMIAEAIIEALPHVEHVRVDVGDIRWSDPKTNKKYKFFMPPKARSMFLAWDRGVKVLPFSFKLQDAQVRERGWRGQRNLNSKRPKYTPTGIKRQHYVAPRTRLFGACYFTADVAQLADQPPATS